MSTTAGRFRFPIALCFLTARVVSWPTETVRKEFSQDAINNHLLREMRLPELEKLIVVTAAEEMNGMDQLIRLKGTTTAQNAETITQLLRARNFEDRGEDALFITGNEDSWWTIDGTVTAAKAFRRKIPSDETLVKLISTGDGQRWILIEQVGF